MARQTHYEVQVYQHGRWSIHAQFAASEQEMAVEEGKSLSQQPGIQTVKVVREVYDSEKGTHRDFIVYKSTDAPPSEYEESDSSHQSESRWEDDDDDVAYDDFGGSFGSDQFDTPKRKKRTPKRKKRKPTTLTALIVKILLVTLFSICLAAMFTVGSLTIMSGKVIFGVRMAGNAESNFAFVAFVGTFLFSATFLAYTFLRGETLAERQEKKRNRLNMRAQEKVQAQQTADAKTEKKRQRKPDKKYEEEARKDLERAMEGIDEFESLNDEQKSREADETNERLQNALKSEEEETPEAAPAEAQSGSLSPHAEKQKAYMTKFLGDTLDGAKTDHKKLDNFNKFGVNLFLAGACEALAQTRELDESSRARVLADSVKVMGFKKSHASTFAEKYEEYLMQDPRYMQMFQAGRNSMNTYYQDPNAASRHLASAMTEWNQPKKKEEQAGPVTVLFTDIAGSTAMTQALGDEGAQKVVRAHNRIVRDALTDHAGKEIKHTGDGIMASFAKTTDGVSAAIQMQRETALHNQQNPDLPLGLKIGLNAGEPISEDNDLFGSTVQMSARIVDKAQKDEIFVSEIVRGICEGKGMKFVNRGGYEMKGFTEPPTLFEVVWREGQAAAE